MIDGYSDEEKAADAAEDALAALSDADDALALELDEDVDEFADELPPAPTGPVEDPNDNRLGPTFFDAGIDLHALDDLTLTDRVSVLERLGPAHFRSKGFSFMGFLQTVYDHIAEEMTKPVTDVAEPAAMTPPETPIEVPSPGTPGEARVRGDDEEISAAEDLPSSREDGRPSP